MVVNKSLPDAQPTGEVAGIGDACAVEGRWPRARVALQLAPSRRIANDGRPSPLRLFAGGEDLPAVAQAVEPATLVMTVGTVIYPQVAVFEQFLSSSFADISTVKRVSLEVV